MKVHPLSSVSNQLQNTSITLSMKEINKDYDSATPLENWEGTSS